MSPQSSDSYEKSKTKFVIILNVYLYTKQNLNQFAQNTMFTNKKNFNKATVI